MADTPTPPAADRWSLWFPRTMQSTGLLAFVYEVVVERQDRPWILLVAMAMMLGGVGLRLVLNYVLGRVAP
jgi:hypothetical protein